MPSWGKIEKAAKETPEKEIADLAGQVRSAMMTVAALSALEEKEWRTVMLLWVRSRILKKMGDRDFVNKVYGSRDALALKLTEAARKPVDEAVYGDAWAAIVDGVSLAVTESVLDEILKVK